MKEKRESSLTDIHALFQRHEKAEHINLTIQELESSGFIEIVKEQTNGRPKTIFKLSEKCEERDN